MPEVKDKVADIDSLKLRRDGQLAWLQSNHPDCFSEQKHCHKGTSERAYWHYGYAAALTDVLVFLGAEKRQEDSTHDDQKAG